jgi:hypothetical protein
VKGHPSMPVEAMLRELDIDPMRSGIEVSHNTIGDDLARAALVLVCSSAVAIEALAYDCDVLVPIFAGSPCLSPLAGYPRLHRTVASPAELRAAVATFKGPRSADMADEKRRFVREYWLVDPSLRRWSHLLGLDSARRVAQAPPVATTL